MRNRSNFNDFFIRDRKILYIVLSIVMVSVLTLTVVYAALSTTLNINGNTEVTAASWDIYLDNVELNSSSATSNVPTISNKTTASFSTTLSKPGDFYEFTIDVVNNGSIDAMIDSVTKTPELTDSQKKYLNYIIEYQNGENITTKQLVAKNSFVRLKVKVEFRKDLTTADLPSTSETLDLSFKVNYVQSDETGISVPSNGKETLRPTIINGDLETVGSEVALGDEHFYIISNTNGKVTMLAKYNLEVGDICTSSTSCTPIDNPSGIQNSQMMGFPSNRSYPRYGIIEFSNTNYWKGNGLLKEQYGASYPAYVYDSNSKLYSYIENYKIYLESHGAEIEESRLISLEELELLGCISSSTSCSGAPEWVYATSYWSGTAFASASVWSVNNDRYFSREDYSMKDMNGVRPVIVIAI